MTDDENYAPVLQYTAYSTHNFQILAPFGLFDILKIYQNIFYISRSYKMLASQS